MAGTGRGTALGAYAMLAVVMMFWAGNAIVGRTMRDDIGPFALSLVRWIGALALVLPFAWAHLRRDAAAVRAAWKPVLVLGLSGVGAFNALLYTGLHHTTASNALLLQAATPALVLAIDRITFGIRARVAQLVGVVLSTAGVVLVVTRADPAVLLALDFGRGDLLILTAVTIWAGYTSLLRLKPTVHPLSLLATTFAIGAAALVPFALAETATRGLPALTPPVIGAFGYVAVFPSLLAYLLYNIAVERVGAGPAGQAITLLPLFGALLAALLLDEALHGYHFVGMALILAGIVTTAATPTRPPGER